MREEQLDRLYVPMLCCSGRTAGVHQTNAKSRTIVGCCARKSLGRTSIVRQPLSRSHVWASRGALSVPRRSEDPAWLS